MRRSIQLHDILKTDLILEWISQEWDSRESAMASYKKLIDVPVSLNRNCHSFTKEKVYQK